MTGRILDEFKQKISTLTLLPGSGGCFEFTVNGDLIHSKLATGSFPDERAMLAEVRSRLPGKH